jgi:hypothetical protein
MTDDRWLAPGHFRTIGPFSNSQLSIIDTPMLIGLLQKQIGRGLLQKIYRTLAFVVSKTRLPAITFGVQSAAFGRNQRQHKHSRRFA